MYTATCILHREIVVIQRVSLASLINYNMNQSMNVSRSCTLTCSILGFQQICTVILVVGMQSLSQKILHNNYFMMQIFLYIVIVQVFRSLAIYLVSCMIGGAAAGTCGVSAPLNVTLSELHSGCNTRLIQVAVILTV